MASADPAVNMIACSKCKQSGTLFAAVRSSPAEILHLPQLHLPTSAMGFMYLLYLLYLQLSHMPVHLQY